MVTPTRSEKARSGHIGAWCSDATKSGADASATQRRVMMTATPVMGQDRCGHSAALGNKNDAERGGADDALGLMVLRARQIQLHRGKGW